MGQMNQQQVFNLRAQWDLVIGARRIRPGDTFDANVSLAASLVRGGGAVLVDPADFGTLAEAAKAAGLLSPDPAE